MSKFKSIVIILVLTISSSVLHAKYSGGEGNTDNPYLISTPQDLNSIGSNIEDFSSNFSLTNDIDLSSIENFSTIGNLTNHFRGVFSGNNFTIHNLKIDLAEKYDGIGLFGYTNNAIIMSTNIKDANINAPKSVCVGILIGNALESRILGCTSSGTIKGCSYVGGLIGENCSTIEMCSATAHVYGEEFSTGGLVGTNYETISQSFSNSIVQGNFFIGGFIGHNEWNTNIVNCYSLGEVSGLGGIGGFIGRNDNNTKIRITNCYTASNVNISDIPFCTIEGQDISNCFWDTEVSGITTGGNEELVGLNTDQMQTAAPFLNAGWDFVGETLNGTNDIWTMPEQAGYPILSWQEVEQAEFIIMPELVKKTLEEAIEILNNLNFTNIEIEYVFMPDPSTGEVIEQNIQPGLPLFTNQKVILTVPEWWQGGGSADDPYILTKAGLLYLIENEWYSTQNMYFVLDEDIDLEGQIFNKPSLLFDFQGYIDGQEHAITNFTLKPEDQSLINVFRHFNGGLKNIAFTGLTFDCNNLSHYTACFIEGIEHEAIIDGLDLDITFLNCKYVTDLAGLAYLNESDINNVSVEINAQNTRHAAGLVLINRATILNCRVKSNITGYNCYGLVGENDGTITGCKSNVNITGIKKISGFAGINAGEIVDCSSSGIIVADYNADEVAGLVSVFQCSYYPEIQPAIENCVSDVNIFAFDCNYVGGLVARTVPCDPLLLADSSFNGRVHGQDFVGGLVGFVNNTCIKISNCKVNAKVSGRNEVGGLIGFFDGPDASISNCHVKAQINASDLAGGLVGSMDESSIEQSSSDCFISFHPNSGSLSHTGGLVGINGNGTISGCLAMGHIRTDNGTYIGGFIGLNDGAVSNSHSATNIYIQRGDSVGGFTGRCNHEITNSYSDGQIFISDGSGVSALGGFTGYNSAQMIECYWDKQAAGMEDSIGCGDNAGIYPRTTDEICSREMFESAGWDFTGEISNGQLNCWWAIPNHPPMLPCQANAGDFDLSGCVDIDDLCFLGVNWLNVIEGEQTDPYQPAIQSQINLCQFAQLARDWQKETQVKIYEFPIYEPQPDWICGEHWYCHYPDWSINYDQFGPEIAYTGLVCYTLDLDHSDQLRDPTYMVAGPFNFTNYKDIKLSFAQWLSTQDIAYGFLNIDISFDGQTWKNIWTNSGIVNMDTDWKITTLDLGQDANGQSDVYIRFGCQSFAPWVYSQGYLKWFIDDIRFDGIAIRD